jgi:transglutaminase-like putative cysteine protease
MAIHVALHHRTRAAPAPHCRTPILAYSLNVPSENHFINWQQDPQSNYLARLVFPEPTTEFFVEVDLVAEMAVFNPFDFFLEPCYAEEVPFHLRRRLARELRPFLETEPAGPRSEFLAKVPARKPPAPSISWSASTSACSTKSAM